MKQRFSQIVLLMAAASFGQAHFVFVVPEGDAAGAKVFISETLQPDPAVGPQFVSGAKLSLRNADGNETSLGLVQAGDVYRVAISGRGTRLVHGLADLGLSQAGATKPYLLVYHPKAILGDAFARTTIVGGETPVEIIPLGKPGALRLQLLAHNKPQPNAEITVILPDGTQQRVKTDAMGQTELFSSSGRYGAWARYWETGSGEREGKKRERELAKKRRGREMGRIKERTREGEREREREGGPVG